jgi:hypothetical protein
MTKTRSRFLCTIAVLACCLSSVSAKPQANKLPEWKPAPEVLRQLSAPVQVEAGSLRVPKGFEQEREEAPHGLMYMWGKKARKEGVDQSIALISPQLTPELFHDYTLKTALDDLIVGYQRAFKNWKQTTPQSGLINGAQALRLHWSGATRKRDVKVEGSIFMVQMKDRFVLMITTVCPNDKTGMKLTEAAALTFKPK